MLKKEYIVEKRNILNEFRCNTMNLQEIRFLSIYLSKINARDLSTREVVFSLEDFRKIMDLGKVNKSHIQSAFTGLLQKVVSVPNENGMGFTSFQLFKECELYQKDEEWFVEIDAHDKALPLLFDFKEKYFTYELWNALMLKSSNQLRMYELLKQYEKIGTRTVSLSDLKAMLGISSYEYPAWQSFKVRVLEACQAALQEHTDICYTYEPVKKGRKFTGVVFTIRKNDAYVDYVCLEEYLNVIPKREESKELLGPTGNYELLDEATNGEFTPEQLEVIFNVICTLPIGRVFDNIELGRYHYIKLKYAELNTRTGVKNRYSYFLKMIESI